MSGVLDAIENAGGNVPPAFRAEQPVLDRSSDLEQLTSDVLRAIILFENVQRMRTTASTKKLIKRLEKLVRLATPLADEIEALETWLTKHSRSRVEGGTSPDVQSTVRGILTIRAAAKAELRRARENNWAREPLASYLPSPKVMLISLLETTFEKHFGKVSVSKGKDRESPQGPFIVFALEVSKIYRLGLTPTSINGALKRARKNRGNK